MITLISFLFTPLIQFSLLTCINCNRPAQDMIFNETFLSRLTEVVMPFPILVILVSLLYGGLNKVAVRVGDTQEHKVGPLVAAGTLIGMGMGGFIDGILLHQILQWHQMISNIIPPVTLMAKQVNTFWDGIFHAFTWLLTTAGIFILFRTMNNRRGHLSGKVFTGALILGWGIFNSLDSIIDHYWLKLHNIRENTENPMIYNHVFFVFALLLILLGWLIIRAGKIENTKS